MDGEMLMALLPQGLKFPDAIILERTSPPRWCRKSKVKTDLQAWDDGHGAFDKRHRKLSMTLRA